MTGPRIAVTSRISRRRRRLLDGVAVGLWLTGLAWLLSHDVFVPEGEFGPVYRSTDAWLLTIHGGFGFAALWVFGLLWGVHITSGWVQRRRIASGATLFGCVSVLVATGYGLYYCGNEAIRSFVSIAHWSLGLAGLAAFLVHRLARRRR